MRFWCKPSAPSCQHLGAADAGEGVEGSAAQGAGGEAGGSRREGGARRQRRQDVPQQQRLAGAGAAREEHAAARPAGKRRLAGGIPASWSQALNQASRQGGRRALLYGGCRSHIYTVRAALPLQTDPHQCRHCPLRQRAVYGAHHLVQDALLLGRQRRQRLRRGVRLQGHVRLGRLTQVRIIHVTVDGYCEKQVKTRFINGADGSVFLCSVHRSTAPDRVRHAARLTVRALRALIEGIFADADMRTPARCWQKRGCLLGCRRRRGWSRQTPPAAAQTQCSAKNCWAPS